MSLHLSVVENPSAKPEPKLVRLPKAMAQKVRDYAAAKKTKAEAESTARSAENTVKALRNELRETMQGQAAAVCDNMVLALKTSADSEAAITLPNGEKIKWSMVSSILIGNRTVAADGVTLYGGRTGSTDIVVTGT